MAELLYPRRKRCKTCGKAFPLGGPLLGLYCSAACAGRGKPATSLALAPRGCKTDRGSKGAEWHWKRKYASEEEIADKLLNDPSTRTYWCVEAGGCLKLHLGHSHLDVKTEATRRVSDLEAIADILKKERARRGLTPKEAATRAQVRPIRLRELEAADPASSWDAFFALSKSYGLRWAAIFRSD